MCRNIKILHNFDPPAALNEIQDASLQFVRKVSGIRHPSGENQAAFSAAVDETAVVIRKLLSALVSRSRPRNREADARRARERSARRFGSKT